jgi:PP-loop superfamily ATP-utilizing enzyme
MTFEHLKEKTIVVWFSCGAASAVAAKKTLERYGRDNLVRIVNNPIAEEDNDNRRFMIDVQDWLGVEIETATNYKFPSSSCVEVWDKRRFMSGPKGAPCTKELKKNARQQWEDRNHHDFMVLGFTADEKKRHERFILTERSNVLPVLIDAGITKQECYGILRSAGVTLPRVYALGYPNANCIGCVKATSATYWNHVRKTHPEVFQKRAEQSRQIGAKLVRNKGERVFLDELPETAKGRSMKNMDFECGIFCEERT